MTVELSGVRVWRLWAALRTLVRRSHCGEDEMRKVLGHLCYVFLLRRGCLSALSAAFSFACGAGRSRWRLWPSVRRELSVAAGLLPLCFARVGLQWSEVVRGFDTSLSGVGVGSSH